MQFPIEDLYKNKGAGPKMIILAHTGPQSTQVQ